MTFQRKSMHTLAEGSKLEYYHVFTVSNFSNASTKGLAVKLLLLAIKHLISDRHESLLRFNAGGKRQNMTIVVLGEAFGRYQESSPPHKNVAHWSSFLAL